MNDWISFLGFMWGSFFVGGLIISLVGAFTDGKGITEGISMMVISIFIIILMGVIDYNHQTCRSCRRKGTKNNCVYYGECERCMRDKNGF